MPCLADHLVAALATGTASTTDIGLAETHLDGCETCRELLVATASASGSLSPSDELDWRLHSGAELVRPGRVIDRYTVIERIGSGATSVVYAAYDPKLDRCVALKLLRAFASRTDDADSEKLARDRLLVEAKALARINHPNVVAVHDVNVHGGTVFVAMEFVRGTSLAHTSHRPLREKIELLLAAARGLAAAHDQGIIHRDFKPANVMVSEDDTVKVTDFGLAALSSEVLGATTPTRQITLTTLTQTGAVVGTPAYNAPELNVGHGADECSDIYAFGITAFEIVSGKRPDEAPKALDESDAPGWLRDLIGRATSEDRKLRPSSMQEVVAALSRRPRRRWVLVAAAALVFGVAAFLIGGHTSETPGVQCNGGVQQWQEVWNNSDVARLATAARGDNGTHVADNAARIAESLDRIGRDWSRSHRRICEATHREGVQSEALLDIRMSCLASFARETEYVVEELLAPDAASLRDQALIVLGARDSPTYCEHINEGNQGTPPQPGSPQATLAARLDQAQALLRAHRFSELASKVDTLVADARSQTQPFLLARALDVLARYAATRDESKQAQEAALEAASLMSRVKRWDELARIQIFLSGLIGARQGRLAEGKVWNQAAESILASLSPSRLDLEADRERELADMYLFSGDYDQGIVHLEQALETETAVRGRYHVEVANHLSRLGAAERQRGNLDRARTHLQESLDIIEKILGPDHPELAQPLANLGSVLRLSGNYKEATALSTRAVALLRGAYGSDHPTLRTALSLLGHSLVREKRLDEARAAYGEALLGASSADEEATVLGYIANVDVLEGRFEPAISRYREILERRLAVLAADHPSIASLRLNLGSALGEAGHFKEGLRELREARRIWINKLGEEDPRAASPLVAMAEIEKDRKHCGAALELFDQYIAIAQAKLGDAHPHLASAYEGRAQCLAMQGRHHAATLGFKQAREVAPGSP